MAKLLIKLSLFLCLLGTSGVSAEQSVIAAKAEQSLLIDIAQLSGDKLVAVGERGHILLSNDNGESWQQVVAPTESTLTAVTFIDDLTGFAVGHQQVILKTIDGGETWALQYQNKEDVIFPALMDVWFRDGGWGVAVGAYGLYLHTKDGGQSWEQMPLAELEDPDFGLPHFYSMGYDGKNNRLFMAGELGFIAVSEDFGETWSRLESPYEGSFFHVAVSNSGSLHLMGLRGHLFRSEDQGETWDAIKTNSQASINSMIELGGSQLMYLGVDGVLLFSNDDGKTVRKIQRQDRNGLMAGVLTGVNSLVVVGEKGVNRIGLDGQNKEQ
ncbi:WD40/YVTN/BNR-like repeat-containing protein [Pleionea mediterranea]|uniref:Photosystem II stability/assembly factor-like uncharacterized protein n=1 Tax=Pleionea mediterranea TaxID=523701 RepID=A0A316FXG1_9GAMM|nr:YCF48-related protein [Pleionea mediterranea]PWK53401.1 photosystem II stability/assembly factor-like uncharacterized protein [Pleionea mediterranea]